MRRETIAALLPYEFVISAELHHPPQALAALCRCEMFAADAASVELWQGERRVWSSVPIARLRHGAN